MTAFIVTNLMRQHGLNLRLPELGHQCIEQYNAAKTAKAGKESVGMGGTLGAIHDFNRLAKKTCPISERHQPRAGFTFR